MKQVHHLAIIAQPAFVDGKKVDCPHCHQPALVREDGSAYCLKGSKSFAPESTDGELFTMRQDFDKQHGITLHHRQQMVPLMLVSHGFEDGPDGRFNPLLADAHQRLASGMPGAGHHRTHA
jgi:hypothetical protein